MPLIVKVNPTANYPNDSLLSQQQVDPEYTETSPLLKEKIRAKHRHFREAVTRRLRQSLRMRRLPVLMLILIEVFERFAYYGILINFALFLNKCCGWPLFVAVASAMAFSSVSWFMCAVCGVMADSRFGRYNTIVCGFLVYFIGAVILVVVAFLMGRYFFHRGEGLVDEPWILMILLVGLLSVSAGEGAVKANLSAFGADQLKMDAPRPDYRTLFNCFYWMSNVISLLCLGGITYIQQLKWNYAFTIGFGIPAFSLTLAYVSFLCCRKYFSVDRPLGTGIRNIWLIVKQAWSRRHAVRVETRELIPRSITSNLSSSESDWLDRAAITYGGTFLEGEVNEVRCLWKVVVFSILLIPYWMIYAQLYSTFILQGLHLQAEYREFIVPAAWPSLCEIVILLILVPVIERGVYPGLSNKCGFTIPMLSRVILGMLLAAGSAGMAGLVEKKMTSSFLDSGADNHTASGKTYFFVRNFSIWWQIPQYSLMGVSEVFTSIPALQLVLTMCPSTPQSVTTAVYNLMISVGSVMSLCVLALTAYQWGWYPRADDDVRQHYLGNNKVACYYWLLAVLMLIGAFWTYVIGRSYNIGLNKSEFSHQQLINEEPLGPERLPTLQEGSRVDHEAQTSQFVELS